MFQPGRVVTLVPSDDPQERVYGVAYQIPKGQEEDVTSHLDFREKGGYEKRSVIFHPTDTDYRSFSLDIYIGTEDNPFYLGPASLHELAHQIYNASGPSGPNTEYLFQLAEAMRLVVPGIKDPHLEELEGAVRNLCEMNGNRQ